jgi:hypothetical protein
VLGHQVVEPQLQQTQLQAMARAYEFHHQTHPHAGRQVADLPGNVAAKTSPRTLAPGSRLQTSKPCVRVRKGLNMRLTHTAMIAKSSPLCNLFHQTSICHTPAIRARGHY